MEEYRATGCFSKRLSFPNTWRRSALAATAYILFSFGVTPAAETTGSPMVPATAMPPHACELEESALESLRVYILPANTSTIRGEGKVAANYISGMPVVLHLRIVNEGAKKGRPNAKPVYVPAEWTQFVSFDVFSGSGEPEPNASSSICLTRETGPKISTKTIEVFRNELHGTWTVPGATTRKFSGRYRIVPIFCGRKGRDVKLDFDTPESEYDKARVDLGLAYSCVLSDDYATAAKMLKDIVDAYGNGFHDGPVIALVLLGDVLSEMDKTEEALNCYSDYLEWWRQEHEPPRVMARIRELKDRLNQ